ncbi:hypothetical protein GS453_14680 [Rhodococcus hoagii]|uniref:Uncharacterized protein n=1 Tax=Rhodococcus hoagii TaxID=43767 RepID=A0AAP2ALH9_RHOHA|nr:hypothetical protein [Prescottella equi]MBM4628059.1 hypothetical protein [Prescottella equi]
MTGPEHFAEAQRLLAEQMGIARDGGSGTAEAALMVAEANAHATLALTALSASDRYVGNAGQAAEWVRVLHPPAPTDDPASE